MGASMIGDKVFGLTSTKDQVQVIPHEVTFPDPIQELSISEPIQDAQICAEDYLIINGPHAVSMWDISGTTPKLFWQYINPNPIQQIRCSSFRFFPRVLITDQSESTAYFVLKTGALPTKPDSVLIPGEKIYDADFHGLGTEPELLLTAGLNTIYLWSATQTGTQLTPLATLHTKRIFSGIGEMKRAFFTWTGDVVAIQGNDINEWWVNATSPTTKFTPDRYTFSDPRIPNANPVVWAKPTLHGVATQFTTFHQNGDVQYWSLDILAPIEIFIGAAKNGTLTAFDSIDEWLSDWIMDVDQNAHTLSLWTTIDVTGTFSVPDSVTSTVGLNIKQALYNADRFPATLSEVNPGQRQCLPGIETWSRSYYDDQDPSISTARIEICSAKAGFEPKVLTVDTRIHDWTFLQTENNKIQILPNQPILRPFTATVL